MPVLALLEKINRLIDSNPVNPGVETRVALEGLQGPVGLDEGVLHEVVGVLVIGRHVINSCVNPFLVTADQFVVGADVFGLGGSDKGQVADLSKFRSDIFLGDDDGILGYRFFKLCFRK
jgi:hypothetical protein